MPSITTSCPSGGRRSEEHLGEPEQRAGLGVELEVALDDLAHAIGDRSIAAAQVIAEPPVEQLDRLDLRAWTSMTRERSASPA
jgi:hypothetical protein